MDRSYRDFLSKNLDEVTQNFSSKNNIQSTATWSKWTHSSFTPDEIDLFLKSEFGGVYDGYNTLIGEYVNFFSSRPAIQLQLWFTLDSHFKARLGGLGGKPMSVLVFNLCRSRLNYVAHHDNSQILLPYPVSLMYGNLKDDYQDKRWDETLHFQMTVRFLDDLLKKNKRSSHGLASLVLGSATINRIDSAVFKSYWDLYPDMNHPHRDFYPAMLASAFVFDYMVKNKMTALSFKPRTEFETISSDYVMHLEIVKSFLRDQNNSIIERNAIYFKKIIPNKGLFEIPKNWVDLFYKNEAEMGLASAMKIHGISAPFTLILYNLKPGDSWERIAGQFNVKQEELLKINCSNGNLECLRPKLFVPVHIKDSLFYTSFDTMNYEAIQEQIRLRKEQIEIPKEEIKPVVPQARPTKVYVVKSGDTLSHIARKYRVSVKQIKTWNRLKSDVLQIGQKIVIKK